MLATVGVKGWRALCATAGTVLWIVTGPAACGEDDEGRDDAVEDSVAETETAEDGTTVEDGGDVEEDAEVVADTGVEDTAVEDTAVEDTAVQDTAVEDTALEDTAVQDTAVEDTAVEDTAVDTAVEDTAVDTAVEDTAVEDSGDDAVNDTLEVADGGDTLEDTTMEVDTSVVGDAGIEVDDTMPDDTGVEADAGDEEVVADTVVVDTAVEETIEDTVVVEETVQDTVVIDTVVVDTVVVDTVEVDTVEDTVEDVPETDVGCGLDGATCAVAEDCCSGHCLDLNGTNIEDSPRCVSAESAAIYEDFQLSLHRDSRGMAYFYEGTAEDPGFFAITGVPYEELACKSCHRAGSSPDLARLADGTDVPVSRYEQSCADCHANPYAPTWDIADSTCIGCHSRQGAGINLAASPNPTIAARFSDVHRVAGLRCIDCHTPQQMHGNGTAPDSMLQARQVRCQDCHSGSGPEGPIDSSIPEHDQHADGPSADLDCNTCHVQTVATCYSCHFDTEVEANTKRYFGPPPLSGFVFLVNDERSGGTRSRVTIANFQALTWQGDAFAAFAPYFAHTVTTQGRTCGDCHGSPNVVSYMEDGTLQITTWTPPAQAGAAGALAILQGIIPIPVDWRTAFLWDFVGSDVLIPALADFSLFVDLDGPDFQMLEEFASPLTEMQMMSLEEEQPPPVEP